jgi:hypothetical protein
MTIIGGTVADQGITLHENNDETLAIAIVRQDPADDLTAVVALELYLKPDACTADDDPYTLLLTSANPAQISITLPRTADRIDGFAYIPAAALADPYDRWLRIDGLNSSGQRRTAVSEPVTIENT